jgi:(2Fe-2S) ferredoxin
LSRIERHFFVCVNERPDGGKPACAGRGARAILEGLELGLAANPEIWTKAAVTESGCLGPCFEGPTIVVYPEGRCYVGVRESDVDELVREHLVGGRPLARLTREPDPE